MEIRRFRQGDEEETARVVAETLRRSNSGDYSPEYIEQTIQTHSAQALLENAKQGHFCVICEGERIVGCGGIAPYWGSETESICFAGVSGEGPGAEADRDPGGGRIFSSGGAGGDPGLHHGLPILSKAGLHL